MGSKRKLTRDCVKNNTLMTLTINATSIVLIILFMCLENGPYDKEKERRELEAKIKYVQDLEAQQARDKADELKRERDNLKKVAQNAKNVLSSSLFL
jgi:hypothetical protein